MTSHARIQEQIDINRGILKLIDQLKAVESDRDDWKQIATGNAKVVDALRDSIRALIGKWQADADLCDEAGIESPTMPIRSAIADLRGILGVER